MSALTISFIVFVISFSIGLITMGTIMLKPVNYNTIAIKIKTLILSGIASVISLCFFVRFDNERMSNINPGEIYIKKTTSDNPFVKRTPTDTMRIIDVKGGYALYVSGKDTLSAKKAFIYNTSKRIK